MTRYAPQWLQQGSYAGSADRRLIGALWPAPASTGCAVSVSSGMVVNVAAGQVAVPTQNNTGTTLCSSDAVEPVTLAAAGASGANRYDVVICQPRGNDLDGGANNDFLFTSVTGTTAGSPTVPATPAGAVALAQIYVPGASASVTAGNITDIRPGPLGVALAQVPIYRNVITMGSGNVAATELILGSQAVPVIPYPHRIRYYITANWNQAGAGTVDLHVRYNTTGAGPAVGDTLHRQFRASFGVGQMSMTAQGAIDRTSGTTLLSAWALTSGQTATPSSDRTLAEFEVIATVS